MWCGRRGGSGRPKSAVLRELKTVRWPLFFSVLGNLFVFFQILPGIFFDFCGGKARWGQGCIKSAAGLLGECQYSAVAGFGEEYNQDGWH